MALRTGAGKSSGGERGEKEELRHLTFGGTHDRLRTRSHFPPRLSLRVELLEKFFLSLSGSHSLPADSTRKDPEVGKCSRSPVTQSATTGKHSSAGQSRGKRAGLGLS